MELTVIEEYCTHPHALHAYILEFDGVRMHVRADVTVFAK